MFSDYRTIIISECRTFFFISLIIRYNNDKDFSSVLFNISVSLLDILISDSSYKGSILAFLAATVTLKSLSYLMLYNRYYSIFYS